MKIVRKLAKQDIISQQQIVKKNRRFHFCNSFYNNEQAPIFSQSS